MLPRGASSYPPKKSSCTNIEYHVIYTWFPLPGIEEAFHGGHTYIRVASKQLVGMLLIIYAKAEVSTHIKNVSTDAQGERTRMVTCSHLHTSQLLHLAPRVAQAEDDRPTREWGVACLYEQAQEPKARRPCSACPPLHAFTNQVVSDNHLWHTLVT